MATSTVTTKTTPRELQVIAEALRMYHHAWKNWNPVTKHEKALDNFVNNLGIIEADPRRAILMSGKLIADLGLK